MNNKGSNSCWLSLTKCHMAFRKNKNKNIPYFTEKKRMLPTTRKIEFVPETIRDIWLQGRTHNCKQTSRFPGNLFPSVPAFTVLDPVAKTTGRLNVDSLCLELPEGVSRDTAQLLA